MAHRLHQIAMAAGRDLLPLIPPAYRSASSAAMGVRVREAQAVRAQVTFQPGQKVTKKLLAQYGDQLVSVRDR